MTVFWIWAVVVSLAVFAIMFWPFLKPAKATEAADVADYDAAVYKSQLDEVKRDLARGELSEEEAEAARVEIARRLLQADAKRATEPTSEQASGLSKIARLIVGLGLAGAIAGGTAGVYLQLGNPAMPNMPFAERAAEREAAQMARQNPALNQRIEELKAQAEADSENQDIWIELAQAQMQKEDFAQAIFSYAEAVRINRQTYGVLAAYGEAQVMAANGIVDEELAFLFREALSFHPEDPRPVFYLARHEFQSGNPEKGADVLIALLSKAEPGAGWVGPVRQELLRLADQAGLDIEDKLASLPVINGPTAEQQAEAATMAPEERQEMIASMVSQLEERLAGNPDVAEDWRKLARVATVLGREGQLIEAYDNLIRLEGESVPLLLSKANGLMEIAQGRPTVEILSTMGRILELDPQNPDALWFSAMAALSIGDKVKARALVDQALESIGENNPGYEAMKRQAEKLLR